MGHKPRSSVFDPRSFLAGASAGGYAVMAAHLPTLILNWRDIDSILEWAVRLDRELLL